MKKAEWEGLCGLMEDCWPSAEFNDRSRKSYRAFLDDFQPEQVMAALRVLMEDGKPFLPAVAEIVKAVRDLQSEPVPGWAEVWTTLERALSSGSEERAFELANGLHPMVGRFLEVEGWERLSRTPFYDPEYGGVRIKDLHARWDEFVAVARERMRRGLGLARGKARGTLGPHSLDTSALVERLRPPKELTSGK